MRPAAPTDLGLELVRFFEEFLPGQRGLSPNTVRSYRDALVLWLQFTAADAKRPVERLQIRDLTAERVIAFLNHLETERGNGIATRNARLGAIHVFARFLAGRRPEVLGTLQQVIALPYKRGAREVPISYLERAEIEAVLQSIDRTTALGRRDYALFALMFNTGARVQEALDLRRRDVRLDAPPQVRLHGKGGKVRLCPIWPVTAKLLRGLHPGVTVGRWRSCRRAAVHQRPWPTAHALRRALPVAALRRGRGEAVAEHARQEHPPALAASQYGHRVAEVGRGLRHHQPVVGARRPEHDDALRAGRHRPQAPGHRPGVPRCVGAAARWPVPA